MKMAEFNEVNLQNRKGLLIMRILPSPTDFEEASFPTCG